MIAGAAEVFGMDRAADLICAGKGIQACARPCAWSQQTVEQVRAIFDGLGDDVDDNAFAL